MIGRVTYTEALDKFVKSDYLIPYRLHPNARYRTNCYYWIAWENRWFKAEEVLYDFKGSAIPILDHVITRYDDGTSSYICTDLTIYDFRLEKDKFDVRSQEIINSANSYAGGEIEYWFFIHNINFVSGKYKNFWEYLEPYGKNRIDPSKFYFVKADMVNDMYINIRFILDPTKEKFKKLTEDKPKIVEVNDNNIHYINEERKRRRRRHEESVKIRSGSLH
jgi:hypothetical protein